MSDETRPENRREDKKRKDGRPEKTEKGREEKKVNVTLLVGYKNEHHRRWLNLNFCDQQSNL